MNFFSALFEKKSQLPLADLSALQADMHSHLIPGIDDGAQTLEDSLELIKELHQLGYKKLITTPHIMSDRYKNTPEIILDGLKKVREAVKNEGIPIELHAAAEYYLDFDFEAKIERGELLTFGDNYVLFEVSFINPPQNLDQIVFKLQTSGYKPVLAHVERYPYWYNDEQVYQKFKDAGVLLQLNIASLTGYYSPQTKKVAERLIYNNMIDLLGTDCHNMHYIKLLKSCLTKKHLHKALASGRLLNNRL